ncbi:SEC-C domain-containing protein [Rhodococcus sp. O3]|uniref:SEC-C domain-containing protein n=1 Tax=Rhodococcus sp. O3 TaxID=3404919 RepID=UPI003B67BE6D
MSTDLDALTDAALDVLRRRGPLTDDDLAAHLADEGFGDADELGYAVVDLDHPYLDLLPDGRNVAVDTLLEGRVFTHRLSAAEIAADAAGADEFGLVTRAVWGNPDEDRLECVFNDPEDESLVERGVGDGDIPDEDILLLPQGSFAGWSAGDVVAFTVTDGRVRWRRADGDLAAGPDLSTGIGADTEFPVLLDDVLLSLVATDPAAFAEPAVPLNEWIDAAGFDRYQDVIAPRGFDFAEYMREQRLAAYTEELDLDREAVPDVLMFVGLVESIEDGDELDPQFVEHGAGLYRNLADPYVAAVALGQVIEHELAPTSLAQAAEVLLSFGSRELAAPAHWFAGRAAEYDGRMRDAERHYEQSAGADVEFVPSLIDLAHFASDRGDAVRGLTLLDRIEGGDEEPLYELLQFFRPVDRPDLGRNDRCWCGSGRKYKVCHLGKADHPLTERAAWLYQKAAMHTDLPRWSVVQFALAENRVADLDEFDEEYADALNEALADPLITDLVLFECGAFAEFVEQRGYLLPEDELDLARQWLEAKRSLYEVERVQPGVSVTARDLLTGETVEISDRVASRQVGAGELLLTRLVSVGDAWRIVGEIQRIAEEQRAAMLEVLDDPDLDPAELVDPFSGETD